MLFKSDFLINSISKYFKKRLTFRSDVKFIESRLTISLHKNFLLKCYPCFRISNLLQMYACISNGTYCSKKCSVYFTYTIHIVA